MARLYANENFPLAVVTRLRELGHDVLTTHDAGRSNQRIDDLEVLRFASDEQRAVITLNRRDFIRLHRIHSAHCGIIVWTEDRNFAALAARIDATLQTTNELAGQLIRVERSKVPGHSHHH